MASRLRHERKRSNPCQSWHPPSRNTKRSEPLDFALGRCGDWCIRMVRAEAVDLHERLGAAVAVGGLGTGVAGLVKNFGAVECAEFDARRIRIQKSVLGWHRESEHAVSECSNLSWQEGGEDAPRHLCFRKRFRSVRFALGISEDEASKVIEGLQIALPDVAHKLLITAGEMKPHFTTLGLS
jgi:hypothetical protein